MTRLNNASAPAASATAVLAAPSPASLPPATRLRAWLRRYPAAFAIALAVVMLAISFIMQPNLSPISQLASFAPLALAAMATAASVIGGGIDLSISAQMTLTSILFVGYLTPAGLGGYEAIVILAVLGGIVGGLNGVIVVLLRLPAIVVTLATMFIITGINLRLAPRPVILFDGWAMDLASSVWIIPGGLLTIGLPLLLWLLLMRTAFGRNLYAVGGSDATSFSAGINVPIMRILSYVVGGIIASIGGLALTALVSSVDASASSSYIIGAITAIALGGITLAGGRGGMIGAIAGAAVIYLVQNMLTIFGVSQVWLNLVFGALLLFAVISSAIISAPVKEKQA
ncbi:ribose ABC transporter permease [Pseudoclavibacter endophyticus]|nr:ABC transporter permease [Pseudoclavibacter endophyticus]GGA76592.1 ribose ABC transporter permease [Pseudoclavibacter endophyticus]